MIYGYVRVSTALQNVENGRFEVAGSSFTKGSRILLYCSQRSL
jgi:DNA invertase Pin-like site-specific DNA recombinase